MFDHRSELALDRDPLDRFLPWLIAFMVYLAVLALAGVLVINGTAGRWERGLGGTLTVQIAPADSKEAARVRLRSALDVLRATPEVAHAEPIPESRIAALLEPWLGKVDDSLDLPLPQLIDVRLKPGGDFDADDLAKRLAAAVPGAALDDHRVWLDRLLRLIHTVEVLAGLILALIGLVIAGTVVYATRSGLAVHLDAIEVLHLIGAQDSYVARQFSDRALALGLRGGAIGLLPGVATLVGIDQLAAKLQGGPLPELALAPAHWVILAVLPIAVAVIAMLTARLTVMRNLASMF
jgi:cell division transport system permease protein